MKKNKNVSYFIKETYALVSTRKKTTFLSLLCLTLVFFVFLLTLGLGLSGREGLQLLRQESEVAVFFTSDLNPYALDLLESQIKELSTVEHVRFVTEEEAYDQMAQVLGPEADILNYFQTNPFEPYFEVQIQLENREEAVLQIERLQHVTYTRNHQDLLDQVERIVNTVFILLILIGSIVSLTTFILTSFIIRSGIESNRDDIETLFLLGAPKSFVYTPYFLQSFVVATSASVLASLLFYISWSQLMASFHLGVFEPVQRHLLNPFNLLMIALLTSSLLSSISSYLSLKEC